MSNLLFPRQTSGFHMSLLHSSPRTLPLFPNAQHPMSVHTRIATHEATYRNRQNACRPEEDLRLPGLSRMETIFLHSAVVCI